jgi:uncharacterized protein
VRTGPGTRLLVLLMVFGLSSAIVPAAPLLANVDPPLPELTQPVHDFADGIDPSTEQQIDQLSRSLQAASGDVLVVVTVPTIEPYADIREYAVKLFENHGRGIGEKGKDNGVLILLALKERRVRIEVGYGLEQWITDGYAGETSRDYMTPDFREGRYGAGLLRGAQRIAARIAQGRNVTLTGVEIPSDARPRTGTDIPFSVHFMIFLAIMLFRRRRGGPGRGLRHWGGGGWSGWSSGVGPFGGGWSGGGGGGFGGGFGGFGGGSSGGGGGGSSW